MKKHLLTTIGIVLLLPSLLVAQDKTLKLEDIWGNKQFSATTLQEVKSMNDGMHYTDLITTEKGQFIIKKEIAQDKTVDTLFRGSILDGGNGNSTISGYIFNDEENMLLIAYDEEAIYRHSTKANNILFDLNTKTPYILSPSGKQQYATFSPAGDKIAFVRDNNIFLYDIKSQMESQITGDGKRNEIINGATDWVYEEEFSFDQGYQWSPDGKYLAYYRFDESNVKEFNLTYYGDLYPREEKYKYPKAGEDNSVVEIYIYNVATSANVKADVNKEANQYIPRIKWTTNSSNLCVMRLNRLQNKLDLYSCNATTGAANLFFTETNKAYIEISDAFEFLDNNKGFLWTSTIDGYNHIYHYGMDGKLIKQLTTGAWDVIEVYGFDENKNEVYYQAAIKSPMEKGVYASNLGGVQRVINADSGTNKAYFSTGFKNYFITNSGINRPPQITLYNQSGKKIRLIEENKSVQTAMKTFKLNNAEFFDFTTSENIKLNGWMIKPTGFDSNKKYPVIQYMYGGPNSQTVKDEWMGPNYFWFQLLAQKGYLIVSVDNRGTGARGEEFNKCIYKQLGHFETIDQIEVAKWLGKQKYVDASRIGAWGWSYGGYMTSLLITKGAEYFKTAVAVAPVTNWKFYDNIYTERYLQTPQLNAAGYDDNSPINFTKFLKGNYLVIHGTADDNVHMQNSMEMVTALIKDKKQFQSFYYPNKAHGISGARLHLYDMMTNYFIEKL
jgi:dipeptidyl-peptidase 4